MAEYATLASRRIVAAPDQTGFNDGNWTNAFTVADLPQVAQYEVYRGIVTSAPAGASAIIQVGMQPVSFTAPGTGGGSEWDPNQAPIMLKGQEMYFLWNAAAAGTPPAVTLWFRYDTQLPANIGGS